MGRGRAQTAAWVCALSLAACGSEGSLFIESPELSDDIGTVLLVLDNGETRALISPDITESKLVSTLPDDGLGWSEFQLTALGFACENGARLGIRTEGGVLQTAPPRLGPPRVVRTARFFDGRVGPWSEGDAQSLAQLRERTGLNLVEPSPCFTMEESFPELDLGPSDKLVSVAPLPDGRGFMLNDLGLGYLVDGDSTTEVTQSVRPREAKVSDRYLWLLDLEAGVSRIPLDGIQSSSAEELFVRQPPAQSCGNNERAFHLAVSAGDEEIAIAGSDGVVAWLDLTASSTSWVTIFDAGQAEDAPCLPGEIIWAEDTGFIAQHPMEPQTLLVFGREQPAHSETLDSTGPIDRLLDWPGVGAIALSRSEQIFLRRTSGSWDLVSQTADVTFATTNVVLGRAGGGILTGRRGSLDQLHEGGALRCETPALLETGAELHRLYPPIQDGTVVFASPFERFGGLVRYTVNPPDSCTPPLP